MSIILTSLLSKHVIYVIFIRMCVKCKEDTIRVYDYGKHTCLNNCLSGTFTTYISNILIRHFMR